MIVPGAGRVTMLVNWPLLDSAGDPAYIIKMDINKGKYLPQSLVSLCV